VTANPGEELPAPRRPNRASSSDRNALGDEDDQYEDRELQSIKSDLEAVMSRMREYEQARMAGATLTRFGILAPDADPQSVNLQQALARSNTTPAHPSLTLIPPTVVEEGGEPRHANSTLRDYGHSLRSPSIRRRIQTRPRPDPVNAVASKVHWVSVSTALTVQNPGIARQPDRATTLRCQIRRRLWSF